MFRRSHRPGCAFPAVPRRARLVLAALLVPLVVLAGSERKGSSVPKELLERLAESERRTDPYTKNGSCDSRTVWEELDGEGKVERHSEYHSRVFYVNGTMRTELISAIRDGKDVTVEERAKRKKEQEKDRKKIKGSFDSPFASDLQPRYRFAFLGPDPSSPGRIRIGYEPAGDPEVELAVGEAVVDPAEGRVVRLSGHPSKYPWFVDRMSASLVFEEPTPLGSVLSSVEGEGEGGFLFIRKRVRMHGSFRDWRLEPGVVASR